jgi:hypothetical protein
MQGNGSQTPDVGNLVLYSGNALLPPTMPPRLNLDQTNDLHWQSHVRLRYQVEHSTQLSEWAPLGEPLEGTGDQINVPIAPSDSPSSFYRLATHLINER